MRKYILYILFLWIAQESKSTELPISRASNNQLRPSVASSGTNYLSVWSDNRAFPSTGVDIWGRIISISGTPLDSFPICTLLQNQWVPEVAWGGDKYLVVWEENREDIYGQFVSYDGTLIDTVFPIASNAKRNPDIESNGNGYLVVWNDTVVDPNLDVGGQVLASDGSPVGPPLVICSAPDTQFFPRVVSIDTNYLVVWSDFRTGNRTPYGQRVSPSGVLIGGNFSITPKSVPQRKLAIASNDTCVLVVWEEDHGFFGWDIHCSILDADTNVLHSDIAISTISFKDERLPCTCWHPKTSKFIVGWHDYRSGNANIWIRKVGKDGSLDSEQKITTNSAEQRESDIACSNKCFLIVWEDYREGVTNIDIYGYVPGCTGKEEDSRFQIPDFGLNAYPNPFVSFVKFIGVKEGIRIYDIQGRLVKELKVNQVWHGRNTEGIEVPSGTYFVYPVRSDELKRVHSNELERARSSLPIQKIIKL